jgi:predicted Zn-dependent protease
MRILLTSIGVGLILLAQGVCRAETNAAPSGKVIALVNAGAVSPEVLARLEELARKSLRVPFKAVTIHRIETTNLLALSPDLKKEWKENYAAMVALVAAPTSFVTHASFNTDEMLSVVNVTAMSTDNPDLYRARLLKQVVRGAIFALGLKPSRDPLCVSRDYRTLSDLDGMPAVLFPPWQSKFSRLAAERGIEVEKPAFPRSLKAPPPPGIP